MLLVELQVEQKKYGKGPTCHNMLEPGGEVIRVMPERKHSFLQEVAP